MNTYTKGPGIPSKKLATLLRLFILDIAADKAAKEAGVNRNTAQQWFRYWRECIYARLRRAPRFFGEVEMDQKSFGGPGRKKLQIQLKRLSKKVSHQEYKIMSAAIRERNKTQVFGILQRGGDVYCHVIKKADKRTLMPIVRLVVERGAIVYTDKWRGFTDLGLDGYTHHDVNHSLEYVTKAGVHTNSIESFWSFCTRRLAKFNGVLPHTFVLHLKECEFRYNHRDDFAKALKKIL